MNEKKKDQSKYDVCLSFAGEDRKYVNEVAKVLVSQGLRVFYDEYEQLNIWGKDLYSYLDDIYRNSAEYCVIFISKHYAKKLWTNHERKSAQARAFSENKEYLLPVRFDDTEIKGILPTTGYIDIKNVRPYDFAQMIIKKIGKGHPCVSEFTNFLPQNPDLLYKKIDKIYTKAGKKNRKSKDRINDQCHSFFEILGRMSVDEKIVLSKIFIHSCPLEIPKNVHVAVDVIRRYTGFPPSKIKRILGGLKSLGILTTIKTSKDHHLGKLPLIYLEYFDLSDSAGGNATDVALGMFEGVMSNYCEDCVMVRLINLDFSRLSSSTKQEHNN